MYKVKSFEEAKDYCKPQLKAFLNFHGIDTAKNFSCIDPGHEDRHPSMSYVENGNYCYCHSCGKSFDIFSAAEILDNCDTKTAFSKVFAFCGVEVEAGKIQTTATPKRSQEQKTTTTATKEKADKQEKDYKDYTQYINERRQYLDSLPDNAEPWEYLTKRGITREATKYFLIGYDPAYKTKTKDGKNNISGFVFGNGSGGYNLRNDNPESEKADRFRKGAKQRGTLFNGKNIILSTDRPIFITEGEIDAITLFEAGADPADVMALCGIENRKALQRDRKNENTKETGFILNAFYARLRTL